MIAAQPLFSRFDLKKVTTDDIAKRARISKAFIYRYYCKKKEIFDDVVAYEVNQLLTAISEAVDAEISLSASYADIFWARWANCGS